MTKTVNNTEFIIYSGFNIWNDESTFGVEMASRFSSESQNSEDIMADLMTFIVKTTGLPFKLKFPCGEDRVFFLSFMSFFNNDKIENFYESLCENLHDKSFFVINCSSDILPHLNHEQRSNTRNSVDWFKNYLVSKKKNGSLSI